MKNIPECQCRPARTRLLPPIHTRRTACQLILPILVCTDTIPPCLPTPVLILPHRFLQPLHGIHSPLSSVLRCSRWELSRRLSNGQIGQSVPSSARQPPFTASVQRTRLRQSCAGIQQPSGAGLQRTAGTVQRPIWSGLQQPQLSILHWQQPSQMISTT